MRLCTPFIPVACKNSIAIFQDSLVVLLLRYVWTKMFNVNAKYVVVHKCTFVFVCHYTLFQGLKLLGKHNECCYYRSGPEDVFLCFLKT